MTPREAQRRRKWSENFADDLSLVRRVLSEDVDAWHEFVERYGGDVLRVAGRYSRHDDDVRRTLFVDVLVHLRNGALRSYSGVAGLSTWLALVTRHFCIDEIRRRNGRRERSGLLGSLNPLEKRVYETYFVEGLPLSVVRDNLRAESFDVTVCDIAEAIMVVRRELPAGHLQRLEHDRTAREVDVESGRMLEFLSLYTHEIRDSMRASGPDDMIFAREHQHLLERVRSLVDALPEEERTVVSARYDEGLTAKEIAERHGFAAQRRVYTVMDRALRRIRRWLDPSSETC